MTYKVALPDLVSNSYFPAIAAVELGYFKEEGIDAEIELIFPVPDSFVALRDGKCDFVAGSAHAPLWAFPRWKGSKVLCALSQGMYWFLVLRHDIDIERGDVNGLKKLRLGAAPGIDVGLRQLLITAGIDAESENITIGLPPGGNPKGKSFGVVAAQALIDGKIDGFWANGMGAEVAISSGIAKCIIDVRRGDGPPAAFNFTQPALVTSQKLVDEQPEVAAGAVRAIVKTLKALKADASLATKVAQGLFPEKETGLIATLIERDQPYYDANISADFVDGMNAFARNAGLLKGGPVPYEDIVATQFCDLWNG
ncbi:ABC transporter substrate-binding protein [Alphaproteobacteria bacterium]|jgi:NitT/TauT family transport system substrate-binding protein|nr:ABC transporter substrate-binding protein [Alphaproteobacteria bacterium]|tara:strand:- start:53 stop:985 length:933 start_codon:yes stop_codon:yes gene_type:complete